MRGAGDAHGRNPNIAIASNEAIGNAEAAKAAGVPETAIDSAKVVLRHGTPEEMEAVKSGKAKLRKTADGVRARRRASAEPDRPSQHPATRRGNKMPVYSRDPIDDVMRKILSVSHEEMQKREEEYRKQRKKKHKSSQSSRATESTAVVFWPPSSRPHKRGESGNLDLLAASLFQGIRCKERYRGVV